jgi:hypothetical protein
MAGPNVSVKGSAEWGRWSHLRRLRDEPVHLKDQGHSKSLEEPSVYGRLSRGDADQCVQNAASLILAVNPESIQPEIGKRSGLRVPGRRSTHTDAGGASAE